MKLGHGKRLWVAERRGTAVFTRTGRVGRPGIPKAKELKSEDEARAFLEAALKKKLASGFTMLDPDAGLDAPFTLDGARKTSELAKRHQHLGDQALKLVRTGFCDLKRVQDALEAEVESALAKERREREARTQRETEDSNHEDAKRRLYGALTDIARRELKRLSAAEPPEPWINAGITKAFGALNKQGIVALENAGWTQSICWSAVCEEIHRRRAAGIRVVGATYYTAQDVDGALDGQGLYLSFVNAEGEPDAEVAATILDALAEHEVPADWGGDITRRLLIRPFTWFRRPSVSKTPA